MREASYHRVSSVSMRRFLVLVVGAASWAACGGTPAEALRPADPTMPGEACDLGSGTAEPLVVDMPAEQRGDIEIAMKDAVAVVHYDCHTLKLLRDCKIGGTYGFKGMQTKERLLRLENADDVRVNLPTMGPAIAAKLEAEMSRGTTLDVALVMVGKRRTTW